MAAATINLSSLKRTEIHSAPSGCLTMLARTPQTGNPAGVIRMEHMMRRDNQLQRIWSPALAHTITEPVVTVVMGVSGSGKTTVSALLAAALGCQFQEGDDLHPVENAEKMQSGTPLTDADRQSWLRKIARKIDVWRARHESGVLTCSALKRSYRDFILARRPDVTLVYLRGSYDIIHRRMTARLGHFMSMALLNNQFAALQEPTPDEHPITVDVGGRPTSIVAEIVYQLEKRQAVVQDNGQCNEPVPRSATIEALRSRKPR